MEPTRTLAGPDSPPGEDAVVADTEDTAPDEAPTADSSGSAVQGPAAATTPWQQPVAFGTVVNTTGTLPVDGITCRADAVDGAPVITELWEGNALEITGEQVFDGAGGGWYPINCAGVGGFVSAAYVALDAPVVEETVTEEPVVEEPVIEEPVTTEVVAEVVTEETAPVDEVTTEDVVTEVVTEDVVEGPPAPVEETVTETEPAVADEVVTDTATATDSSSEAATDTASPVDEEVVTETTTETETAAEIDTTTDAATTTETETETESTPVEETVEAETDVTTQTEAEADTTTTSEPSVDPEATDDGNGVATPVATDPQSGVPTEPATDAPPATPAPDASPAAPVTPEVVDVSRAIGFATVHGTDGSGLTCRTAADAASPTLTILPERTNVAMLAAPSGGWVRIVCGGQLGYGLATYLDIRDAVLPQFGADDTGRTVAVQGTGGGGLNCRASAGVSGRRITLVPEGASLTIRGIPRDGWLPVVCAGQNGYVPVDYVAVPTGQGGGSEPVFSMSSAGTGTVANTGGGGVRCRTRATTTQGAIITVLREGTRVTLRGTPSRGWAPVTCAGRNGYVSVDYLRIVAGGVAASDGASPGGNSAPGNTSGGVASGSARITGTGSGGLNCRAGAGTQHRVITVLRADSSITIRGAASNGWQPVVCGGQNGFVSTQYVTVTNGSDGGAPVFETTPTGSATVSGTGGSGVRCRTSPITGSIITVLREGTRITLRGSVANGWAPVTCGGRSGYVSASYVSVSNGGTPGGSDGGSNPGSTTGFRAGDRVKALQNVYLRDAASSGSPTAATVPAGTVVLVRGTATNGYYPVDWDGVRGYLQDDYLAKSNAPLSNRGIFDVNNPGSGSTGWSSIWANGNYRIGQELGLTEFAKKHLNGQYAYSPAYGIVGHAGIDVTMPTGTRLYTPVSGRVIFAGGTRYYTHAAHGGGVPGSGELRIQLDNGDQLILGHMSRIDLRVGQRVSAGQYVGLSGSNNGGHVHVEYRRRGGNTTSGFTAVDPRLALGGAMPIITGAGRR